MAVRRPQHAQPDGRGYDKRNEWDKKHPRVAHDSAGFIIWTLAGADEHP
jgi:hypothetical protein